jgi:hypothetical protein
LGWQGLLCGVLMTLFTIVPSSLNHYAAYSLPYILVVKRMAARGLALLILGLLIATIYQKKAA